MEAHILRDSLDRSRHVGEESRRWKPGREGERKETKSERKKGRSMGEGEEMRKIRRRGKRRKDRKKV